MKFKMLIGFIFFFNLYSPQLVAADGIDVFTSTQSFKQDNLMIECTANFEAPWDNLYGYEDVWTLTLFGGYWETVYRKVGEKYTGEFRYAGTNCTAYKKIIDDQTQQTSTIEVDFYFDNLGILSVTNPAVPIDISSVEELQGSVETANLLYSLGEFTINASNAGLIATIDAMLEWEAIIEMTAMAAAVALVSNSVFIYLEQQEIKDQINHIMNDVVAPNLQIFVEQITLDIINYEILSIYIAVMPAINLLLL